MLQDAAWLWKKGGGPCGAGAQRGQQRQPQRAKALRRCEGMKGVRLKALGLALMGALAVFLASCGQQPPTPQTGNLEVTVQRADNGQPIQGAVVSVSGPQSASGVTNASGKHTFNNLPAGNYTVSAVASGFQPNSGSATVQAGQTAQVILQLQPAGGNGGGGNNTGRVARVEIVKVEDASGPLPAQDEENPNKAVKLYAAQTEEAVRVTVRALDAQGNPVSGASIEAGLDLGGLNGVNLFTGCGVTTQAGPVATTGSNGEACFTVYATSVFAGLFDDDVLYNYNNPVKLTVSSNGQLAEAKFFFYNISHLYYISGSTSRATSARAGSDLGTIANSYSFDNPAQNDHTFQSVIYRKQPTSAALSPSLVGYMVYTLNDTSKVSWQGCDAVSADGKTCTDSDGQVTLHPKTPNEGIAPQDLPFQVKVTATLVVEAQYGGQAYEFPLKSYSFTKRWGGTGVRITKSGPRVIGWAGSNLGPNDVTLPKQGNNDALYTYTITVENIGNDVAKNVVVTDVLPAELGFNAAGQNGTYDPILHQVTWSWTTTPQLTQIPVGGQVQLTVTLYARHKPGYAWLDNGSTQTGDEGPVLGGRPDGLSDDPNLYNNYDLQYRPGIRPPIYPADTPYPDPYRVVNVVKVKSEAPGEPGNFPAAEADLDIWVVRPFLTLTKTPLSDVVRIGDTARFTLRVTNVDRASGDSAYAQLKALYPTDYANALKVYKAKVRDLFGRYLDFVNSSSDTGAGTLDGDKGARTLTFEIGTLNLGQVWNGLVDLRVSGSLINQFEDELALTNCARLYAQNLNQYAYQWGPAKVGPQVEPETGTDPRPNPPYTPETGNPDTVGNYLESCASVQDAELTITNLGEFSLDGPLPTSVFVYGDGGVSPFTQVDTVGSPVRVGDTFYYIYTLTNQGTVELDDIDFRINRVSGTSVELFDPAAPTASFAVYRGSGAGTYNQDNAFTAVSFTTTSARIQSTSTFVPLQPGETLVVVVRARAIVDGQSTFQAWAQTTSPIGIQTRIVVDNTTVQPQ
ncbi:carboxypeptidase regulatory-like domain-containing protein [Thermus oshimai]